MRISCIIPTRDRCFLVLEAIESAYCQSRSCAEIIVVDDGSVDSTSDLVAEKYPDVILVRLNGVGPGAARNAGVHKASGDIVMFLDSDDRWSNDHVRVLAECLTDEIQVAYGITETSDEIDGSLFYIPDKTEALQGDCFQALLRWCFLLPSATALRRDTFLAVNGFAENRQWRFGEDWDFFLRLADGYEFGFAPDRPITYRKLHSKSLCNNIDKRMLLDLVGNIRQTAINLRSLDDNDYRCFTRMERIIEEKGEKWRTVQQWYLAMKTENIV